MLTSFEMPAKGQCEELEDDALEVLYNEKIDDRRDRSRFSPHVSVVIFLQFLYYENFATNSMQKINW